MRPGRVYGLSLGSMHGNAHLHWHVAPLPRAYYALMTEHGVVELDDSFTTREGAALLLVLSDVFCTIASDADD